MEVEITGGHGSADAIDAMADTHIDFTYFGSKNYIEAKVKANAQAVF